jgi:Na+-transporting NADH:ubiquinone oxidoreductase subunit NqrB
VADVLGRILADAEHLAIGRGDWDAPAPGLPGGREMRRYLLFALLAAVPCIIVAVYYFGPWVLAMVVTATLAAAAVEIAFGLIRKKPIGGGSLVFAVLLVLILPPLTPKRKAPEAAAEGAASQPTSAESAPASQPAATQAAQESIELERIPLWLVAAGAAFGVFFGKEVFGGTGHHVFSPVLVGKGFLTFSYPTIVKGTYFGSMLAFGDPNAWGVCSGVILLGAVAMIASTLGNGRDRNGDPGQPGTSRLAAILFGPGNWQTLAAILLAGGGLAWGMQAMGKLPKEFASPLHLMAADAFLFGTCFLAR